MAIAKYFTTFGAEPKASAPIRFPKMSLAQGINIVTVAKITVDIPHVDYFGKNFDQTCKIRITCTEDQK
jgi:hypothetical protein